MIQANQITTMTSIKKWEEIAFARPVAHLHISSLALVSLYGRFGAGLFECWIQ